MDTEQLYKEFIIEFDKKIISRKEKFDKKLEIKESKRILNSLISSYNNKKNYPDIDVNSVDAEKLKKALNFAEILISSEEYLELLKAFRKMNYYANAIETTPMIKEMADYKKTEAIIENFFKSGKPIMEHFIIKKSQITEAEAVEEAKHIEQMISVRTLLGFEGFTEVMDQDKLARIFRVIDDFDIRIGIDYKLAIITKALQQDYNLQKLSVRRISKPIEVAITKTIEEEQKEERLIVEKEEVEVFSNDDLAEVIDLNLEGEDRDTFFTYFNNIFSNKSKLKGMLSFAREYWKEISIRITELGLDVSDYQNRQTALANYFNRDQENVLGDDYLIFKNAIRIKQCLDEIDVNNDIDKLSALSIFSDLYKSNLMYVENDEIVFDNDNVEELEEIELNEEDLKINKKLPLLFLDPKGFIKETSPQKMGKEHRKKIYEILKSLMEGEYSGVKHPYNGYSSHSSSILNKNNVNVAKKGGKTRCYYTPVKNRENETIANILILPAVTSKDSKRINEERETANMILNNQAEYDRLRNFAGTDNGGMIIIEQEEIADRIITEMAENLRSEKELGW